ncbi:MAG: hypothetical protein KDK71_04115 [Chlamydiia bacterium]|nr:hypothetical protein [Chlamydiia bacterium]
MMTVGSRTPTIQNQEGYLPVSIIDDSDDEVLRQSYQTNTVRTGSDDIERISVVERIVIIVSVIIGIASNYVYYILGSEFGGTFCTWTNVSDSSTTCETVKILFGVISMIPMLGLSIGSSYDLGKKISTSSALSYCTGNRVYTVPYNLTRKLIALTSLVFGVFFVTVRFYLTAKYSSGYVTPLKVLLIPPSIIIPFAIGFLHVEELLSKIHQSLFGKTNKKVKKLDEFIMYINNAEDTHIKELYDQFQIGRNLKRTFYKIDQLQISISDEAQKVSCFSIKGIFGIIGFVFGALSNYAFINVTIEAGEVFSSLLGIQSAGKALGIFFLVMYILPSVALRGLSTKNRFEEIASISLNTFKVCQCREFLTKVFSTFLGILAALPVTYLAISSAEGKAWYYKPLVFFSFLAPFSVSSFSIEKLINRVVNEIKNRKKGEIEFKKQKVKEELSSIRKQIVLMTDEQVETQIENEILASPILSMNPGADKYKEIEIDNDTYVMV